MIARRGWGIGVGARLSVRAARWGGGGGGGGGGETYISQIYVFSQILRDGNIVDIHRPSSIVHRLPSIVHRPESSVQVLVHALYNRDRDKRVLT